MRGKRSNQSSGLTPQEILRALREPKLRMCDVRGIGILGEQLIQSPNDPYLSEVFVNVIEEQVAAALSANSPFHGSAPPLGVLPSFGLGRAPIIQLPTGEVLSEDLGSPRNILLLGPTGAGKSTWVRLLMPAIMGAPPALALVFDRKRNEIVDAATLARPGLPVLVLDWRQLRIAALQPPPGCDPFLFGNSQVHLLTREQHMSLFASKRPMLETLENLLKKPRPLGTFPVFSDWMAEIKQYRPEGWRSEGYKDAALMAMKQIWIELGQVINYAASDMLDRILSLSGVVVIVMEGLSSPMQALLSSLILNYAYRVRQTVRDTSTLASQYYIIDDGLPLSYGSASSEAEGGMSVLSEMAFMCRSRRMAIVISSQVFGLLSPALRTNCAVTVCFGSVGRDADEVARHMNLTADQAQCLPFLTHGQAVARVHPYPAMLGSVPYIQ